MWCHVIIGMHNLSRKPLNNLAKKTFPGVWKNTTKIIENLQSIDIDFSKIITCKVGSVSDVLFWLDDWLGDGCLASRLPLLYDLDKKKNHALFPSVFVVKVPNGSVLNLIPPLKLFELIQLNTLVNNLNLYSSKDSWSSDLSSDGIFYV